MEDHLIATIKALFTAEELPGGVHAMTSLGIGPKAPLPERPYIVWREMNTVDYDEVSDTSDVEQRSFQIYIYDYLGDFSRINSYMLRLKRMVKAISPFTDVKGNRCSGSRWGGMSADISDQGYDSAVRFATARFTVSPPPA